MSQTLSPPLARVADISPTTVRTRTYQRLLDRFEELVRGGASTDTANILDYYLSLIDIAAANRSRDGATALRLRALTTLLDTAGNDGLPAAARRFAVDRAHPWVTRLRHSPWTHDRAALTAAEERLQIVAAGLPPAAPNNRGLINRAR